VVLRPEVRPRGVTHWRQLGSGGGGGAPPPPPPPPPAPRGEVDAARAAWAAATARFEGDVDSAFFDGASWEQATRIEFWTQGRAYATWLLEWATSPGGGGGGSDDAADLPLVAEAAAVLERAVFMARGHAEPLPPDAFTLKNLGLAYVKLVRAPSPLLPRAPAGDAAGLPALPAIRARARAAGITNESALTSGAPAWALLPGLLSESDWRAKAAERVLEAWGAYLDTREAAADAARDSIAAVVAVLRGAAAGGGGGAQPPQPAKRAAGAPRREKKKEK